ncbi:MAG: (d)CMP kinase [Butyrivibrio sp.]
MAHSIAIDGPAGAGKSTIAKNIAAKLGFIYVDTGAMYRAMAVYFLDNGTDTDSENEIEKACADVSVDIVYEDNKQQVILNGENITGRLRREEVGNTASKTAVYPAVRKKLVELQRKIAQNSNVVMDGRDIGTCVLPDADCKIYLTASVETRADRRFLELKEKGISADLEEIKRDIADRDYRDMHREVSPLRQAEDAVLVDSSYMNIEEVTGAVIDIYNKKI